MELLGLESDRDSQKKYNYKAVKHIVGRKKLLVNYIRLYHELPYRPIRGAKTFHISMSR